MIHDLTIGHLDPEAIRDRRAVALRPLDEAAVARVLAEFSGLKVQRCDGYLVVPWHGREDGERGEAFAARIQAETGCRVADRRNGRIVDLGRVEAGGFPRADGAWNMGLGREAARIGCPAGEPPS